MKSHTQNSKINLALPFFPKEIYSMRISFPKTPPDIMLPSDTLMIRTNWKRKANVQLYESCNIYPSHPPQVPLNQQKKRQLLSRTMLCGASASLLFLHALFRKVQDVEVLLNQQHDSGKSSKQTLLLLHYVSCRRSREPHQLSGFSSEM